jgi:hypothetical protein
MGFAGAADADPAPTIPLTASPIPASIVITRFALFMSWFPSLDVDLDCCLISAVCTT